MHPPPRLRALKSRSRANGERRLRRQESARLHAPHAKGARQRIPAAPSRRRQARHRALHRTHRAFRHALRGARNARSARIEAATPPCRDGRPDIVTARAPRGGRPPTPATTPNESVERIGRTIDIDTQTSANTRFEYAAAPPMRSSVNAGTAVRESNRKAAGPTRRRTAHMTAGTATHAVISPRVISRRRHRADTCGRRRIPE